jgi:Protein of unknown function (DUF1501)
MATQPTDSRRISRRIFCGQSASGLGLIALAQLLGEDLSAQGGAAAASVPKAEGGVPELPHFPARAKRVIYLFQSGGPSHLDLFDYKPLLSKVSGSDLPASIRQGQRLTAMSSGQESFPVVPSMFKFAQHGQSGAWFSELLPYSARVADDLCFVKSLHTEQINHDPAVTFIQTGFQLAGRPSLGSWVSYGLGTMNKDLPAFVVMISNGRSGGDQPLYDRLWGTGFMPSRYQGIKLRSVGEPVLYISDPEGFEREDRRRFIDDLKELNDQTLKKFGDPEINTRIDQYEMAFRMQSSVPELTDLSGEPASTFELYGEDARKPGTFARNCLMARRLAERGVRFIQLYHRGWDHHGNLPRGIATESKLVDQASAGLIQDLKQRGLLDDTLVIWGGEFGRTVYCQGKLTADNYGRDHHGRCFTMWLAGGGVRPGVIYGASDDYGYNIAKDPVSIHDLNATIMNRLGIDHTRLTYKYQGRNFRLTDVQGEVVKGIVS